MQVITLDGKYLANSRSRGDGAVLERARAEVVRARDQEARAISVAQGLAARLERRTAAAHGEGFEAGVAFAVPDEVRRSEPRRRTVERDREGRIVAIAG